MIRELILEAIVYKLSSNSVHRYCGFVPDVKASEYLNTPDVECGEFTRER